MVAAGLGSFVGIERERLTWAAGLRTHMLVSIGACLIMIVSAYGFSGLLGPNVVLDPSRIAVQGFLGAGTILLRAHDRAEPLGGRRHPTCCWKWPLARSDSRDRDNSGRSHGGEAF